MELQDIKTKIGELRNAIETLADESFKLYKQTNNPHTENVADYLHYELTAIACHLSDLEETENEESDIDLEATPAELGEEIDDWWSDLDLIDKCDLANIPYPTTNYGRGDEYYEAEERANKWWHSRTAEQMIEIYTEQSEE